jgi:FAD/FMN-containing dehydrogenase
MTTMDALQGLVLSPDDPAYEDARRPYNAAIDTRPPTIVQVAGPGDVAVVLDAAARTGRQVGIRGTGHHLDGRALSGDVVIDLSALRGVAVDAGARTATVRAGATWADLDAAAAAHGLAVPGARVSHVGVVGTVLGGGEGWLSLAHGLSADNLIAADVVTANGELVRASHEQEPELFWALRGGRVDVGVVTTITLALHPVPARVLGGMLLYPLPALPDVLDVLQGLHRQGRPEFAGLAMVLCAPPESYVPGDLVGHAVCAVVPAWLGEPAEGAQFLMPLRRVVSPAVDAVHEQPYVQLQAALDSLHPWGQRQAARASVLAQLPGSLPVDLIDAGTALPSRAARLTITRIDGAMATADTTSAYPWRAAGWLVNPSASWRHRRHDGRNLSWLRAVHDSLRARGEVATSLNHEPAEPSRVAELFGPQRWTRLMAVKAAFDPSGVFAH